MKLAFLLDVDNALLDNDRVKEDLIGDLRGMTSDLLLRPAGFARADQQGGATPC